MLLPRKWALGLGLLAAAPSLTMAGPLDFLRAEPAAQEATSESPERSNQQVAEEIAKALGKARLVHKNVTIEYKAGVATIGGEIKDASQKALVSRIVGQVPGVQTVENQLQLMTAMPATQSPIQQASATQPAGPVQHAVAQGMPRGQVTPTSFESAPVSNNQEVAQNIAESLSTSGLSGYDIEVRFKGGIASLIGNVENQEQAARAQRATESVPGVNQVLNKLTVKGQPNQIQQTAGYAPYGQPPMGPQYAPQYPPQYAPQPGMGPGPQRPPMPGVPMQRGSMPGGPIQQMQGQAPGGPYSPGVGPQGGPAPVTAPPQYGHAQPVSHQIYNQPYVPEYAWPSYAPYDNYAAVTYPSQYDASAWPYIGPYYPYPQVPLGWRKSTLEWDDGYWSLKFDSKTDRWWWFLNPKNWD
ncbi:MAG: BON domain-containing protein [Planctomycetaceae bacterium]|nr:BON domain-containing protein [Planctomycetaceae bacterium]